MRREHRVWTIGTIALVLGVSLSVPGHGHAAGVPREVFEQMQRITRAVRGCYEQELARDPAFRVPEPAPGVRVRVLRSGALRLELLGSAGAPRVDRCLRGALRRLRFTRDQRTVQQQYPFLFTADGEPRVLHIR